MKNLTLGALVVILCGSALVGGCRSGGPDPKVQAKSLDKVKTMRSLFDKAGGDYTRLSAEEKKQFAELAGGEALAEQNWNAMKFGPGGQERPSGSTPNGGGTGQ